MPRPPPPRPSRLLRPRPLTSDLPHPPPPQVFIALLSTIVLRYDIAFPDAAVDTFLTLTLLTPPGLAVWYEVQALLEDLGHGKRLRRVARA